MRRIVSSSTKSRICTRASKAVTGRRRVQGIVPRPAGAAQAADPGAL